MKKHAITFIVFLAFLNVAAISSGYTVMPVELEVSNLINQERVNVGLSPLTFDERLFDPARSHSEEMAYYGLLTHDSYDGTPFYQRIWNSGYPSVPVSEAVGSGYTTPSLLVAAFMGSQAHRDILLNPVMLGIGVGMSSNYWTVDLGMAPVPTPLPAAVWLFGSGVLGLVGLRRKFGK